MNALPLAALAALVSATAALAQPSAPMVSVYSDISRKACRNLNPKPPSRLEEHEAVPYVCKARDWRVDIRYEGNYVSVRLTRAGAAPGAPQLGAGFDVGDRIEWRGRGAGAAFRPEAAILRLQSRGDDGRLGSVLAILRIEGAKACPVAFLDAGATANANIAARAAADAAAGAACGAANIIGPQTPVVRDVADRSR